MLLRRMFSLRSSSASLALLALLAPLTPTTALAQERFTRADSNDDGVVNLTDAVCALEYLFSAAASGCGSPGCLDALDTNDDGELNISDPVATLGFLFLGAPPPAEPFSTPCGVDPTDDDGLGCASSASCANAPESVRVNVPAALELSTLGSEDFPTMDVFQPLHAAVRLSTGEFELAPERDTEDVALVAEVLHGAEWLPATPIEAGRVRFDAPDAYVFTQSFDFGDGVLTFELDVTPAEGTETTIRCGTFDTCGAVIARYVVGDVERTLHFACFQTLSWVPSPVPDASPTFIFLDDGTRLEIHTRDCESPPVGGDEDPIRRRTFSRASIDIRGLLLQYTEPRRLLHTSEARNQHQEFRILFDDPVDEVYGIDIAECPTTSGGECSLTVVESRAYYLDENLQRAQELLITDFNQGSAEE